MEKNKAVVGISGGIDSAVAARVCQMKGMEVIAVILPYRGRNLDKSMLVTEWLGCATHVLDIGEMVDKQVKDITKVIELDKVDIGNIMARQRMIVQYALARKFGALVAGTENLSEYMLGYFTKHGDAACDFSPIRHLYKTQVWELARKLGVPKVIIDQKPSADLWEGQTDEGELGFDYLTADKVIKRILDTEYKRK
jgi:NAD+ synthase